MEQSPVVPGVERSGRKPICFTHLVMESHLDIARAPHRDGHPSAWVQNPSDFSKPAKVILHGTQRADHDISLTVRQRERSTVGNRKGQSASD